MKKLLSDQNSNQIEGPETDVSAVKVAEVEKKLPPYGSKAAPPDESFLKSQGDLSII